MDRAKKLIEEDRIFKVSESMEKDYYIVKGENNIYEVIYDKRLETYHCTCNNVRLTDCYHIRGCKLYKEGKNDTNTVE